MAKVKRVLVEARVYRKMPENLAVKNIDPRNRLKVMFARRTNSWVMSPRMFMAVRLDVPRDTTVQEAHSGAINNNPPGAKRSTNRMASLSVCTVVDLG